MSDPSHDSVSSSPTRGSKPETSAATQFLSIMGRALLLIGAISIGASAFLPWAHLSTSFGEGPHEIDIGSWAVIHLDVGSALVVLGFTFLLLALSIVIGCTLLLFKGNSRAHSVLVIFLLVLIFVYGGGMLLILGIASSGLSLTWPYYHVTVQHGAGVAILGCLSVALGASMVINARRLHSHTEAVGAA